MSEQVLGGVLLAEGCFGMFLGIVLVARAPRTLATWSLGGYLAVFAGFLLAQGVPGLFEVERSAAMVAVTFVLSVLMAPLQVLFAFAYPHRPFARGPWIPLVLWGAAAAVLLAGFLLGDPTFVQRNGMPNGDAVRFRGILASSADVAVTIVFARVWLTTRPSKFRTQFLFFLLAFLFWNLHDAVPKLRAVAPVLLQGATPRRPEEVLLSVIQVLLVLGFLGAAVRRSLASERREAADNRGFLVAFFVMAPFAFAQFVAPSGLGTMTHLVADGLVLPLLFYGAAKHAILDVDLSVRRGVRGGVLGAVGLVILLSVEQGIQQAVGSSFGIVVGALMAGLAIFALSPLHRLADRVSRRAVPGADSTAAYRAHRRLEIYEVALEGMLRDGVVNLREAKALSALRERLDVTPREHDLIEKDVRARAAGQRRRSARVTRSGV